MPRQADFISGIWAHKMQNAIKEVIQDIGVLMLFSSFVAYPGAIPVDPLDRFHVKPPRTA